MGEVSKIQWTDHTFNGWIGCTKVSPGCAHCYAEMSTRARVLRHRGQETWGRGAQRSRTTAANWKEPVKWNREALQHRECAVCGATTDFGVNADGFCDQCEVEAFPIRPRVFCASLSDWLDDEVPIEWLADLLVLIHATPNLDWQLLTKRPQNWHFRCSAVWQQDQRFGLDTPLGDWLFEWLTQNAPPSNVWIGTTVEDQARAHERIPHLLKIPAQVHFLSCEPLLGPVDLNVSRTPGAADDDITDEDDALGPPMGGANGIDWVIAGGESGSGARLCHIDWLRSLRDQCHDAGVSFFMKQLGANVGTSGMSGPGTHWPNGGMLIDTGDGYFTKELKDKKGGDITEWPDDLQVREFPKVGSEVGA